MRDLLQNVFFTTSQKFFSINETSYESKYITNFPFLLGHLGSYVLYSRLVVLSQGYQLPDGGFKFLTLIW